MSDILVSEAITGAALERLMQSHDVLLEPDLWKDAARLKELLRDARAIIVRNQTQVTAELIEAAPQLRIIARAGAGLDNIDTKAASEAGIVVSYAPHENSIAVAELVLGLMLSLQRRIPAAWQSTRNGDWDRLGFTGRELCAKTLGIVGFGRIGRLVADRAAAFGMTIIASDAVLKAEDPALVSRGIELLPLNDLLSRADIVSVHVPLLESTRSMFNADLFARMKPRAVFINAARGEVVDESALLAALKSGQIGAAALDVRQKEPPAPSPFDALENVILTPHIGAFTHEAQERVVETVCRDVAAVLRGEPAGSVFGINRPAR